MQAGGGNRNATLLGAVVLVAAVIVALVFLLRERRSGPGRPGALPAAPTVAAEPQPTLSGASGSQEAPGLGRAADAATAPAPSAPISTGVLRLEFVSALDGSPVPDLPFLVYRERGGNRNLARGRSDARGRAEVRDLEENVILVETSRRPPFASRVEACWLGRAETRELVVRLDGGARVVGRVVDDAQQPVEGAEVLVAADFAAEPDLNPLDREGAAAVTGPDGRFAVDGMASRPKGVWIVDGEARPERWGAAELFVRKECAIAHRVPDVKPGTTFDLCDVILERCSILAGTVLDPESRPVAGALVTWRPERRYARRWGSERTTGDPRGFRIAPGEPGFRLHPGETLTDTGGRFEIRGSLRDCDLAVWAPSGQRQVFVVPKVPPSERLDDLVLKLDAITMLEVELVDRSGARITAPGPTAREEGLIVPAWRTWSFTATAVAVIRLEDGAREVVMGSADSDGLFRFELKADPSRVRSLALELAGYETLEDRLAGRVQPVTRLSYVLQETPALRLRLKNTAAVASRTEFNGEGAKLGLQICLASPVERQNMTENGCCGLGASMYFEWPEEPREFVLPAIAPRAYWVYLRASPAGADAASFGPFEAGDTVHEIEADLARIARAPDRAQAPPERIEPGRKLVSAYVTARAVDARTDQPIPKFTVGGRLLQEGEAVDYFAWMPVEKDGATGRQRIAPGLWNFTVGAEGYRKVEIQDVLLVQDQVKDFGTIALEPLPAFRARLLERDGSAAPRYTWIRVLDAVRPNVDGAPMARTDAEGRAVLHEDIPERVLLETFEPFQDVTEKGGGAQRLLFDGWPQGDEKEIRLAPWQRVEVQVGGVAIEPPGTALLLWACPAPGEPIATCDHRGAVVARHDPLSWGLEIDATPTRRVYRFRMAAGRYQVYGRDLLHEVPAQEIEVRDSRELQVFDLSSR